MMPEPARHRWILPTLVALGFAARLALAVALGLNKAPEPGSDSQEYDTYAWNVAQGRGYRGMSPDVADQDHLTAYRPPGTSLVWAGLYRVFGHRYDVVRIANCLAGAAAVWLTYAIGRRCFGEAVGLAAAAAYAFYPIALFFATMLLSEALGTFWFLAFLLACLRFADRPSWGGAAVAGVLLGVAILTRPNPAFMVPLSGLWALWQFRRAPAALVRALSIPVVAVATMTPWIVRNFLVFSAFIPISNVGGSGLLQGNNRIVLTDPTRLGYLIWDTRIPEYRDALVSANDEVERDRRARNFAIQWLKDNPDKWLTLAYYKTIRAWTPFLQPHTARLYRLVTLVSWGPVLLLFLPAVIPTLVSFLRRGHPGWIIHLSFVNGTIITLMFWGELRYRYSMEPLCLILAAATLIYGLEWIRGHLDGTRAGLVAPAGAEA
jgi:4-amino-4-deoxy-L-arabinose transferase-like glycosyltransferase